MNIINKIVEEVKRGRMSYLEVLQFLQEKYSYIPVDVLKRICKELEIPKSKIFGILTFYSQFSTEERGKYLIRVCDGTACHVNGGSKIVDMLKREFKLENGKTTKDKKFTLQVVTCLGGCFIAPVCMVNSNYYGNMNEDKVRKLLNSLK